MDGQRRDKRDFDYGDAVNLAARLQHKILRRDPAKRGKVSGKMDRKEEAEERGHLPMRLLGLPCF